VRRLASQISWQTGSAKQANANYCCWLAWRHGRWDASRGSWAHSDGNWRFRKVNWQKDGISHAIEEGEDAGHSQVQASTTKKKGGECTGLLPTPTKAGQSWWRKSGARWGVISRPRSLLFVLHCYLRLSNRDQQRRKPGFFEAVIAPLTRFPSRLGNRGKLSRLQANQPASQLTRRSCPEPFLELSF